jgi:hypothetical protein
VIGAVTIEMVKPMDQPSPATKRSGFINVPNHVQGQFDRIEHHGLSCLIDVMPLQTTRKSAEKQLLKTWRCTH